MAIKLVNIWAINWFKFENTGILPIRNTFITGENKAGKSSLIDAFNTLIRVSSTGYNKSARDGSSNRTLKGYVRGITSDSGGYIRSGNVRSYILAEFHSEENNKDFVLGVFFESPSEESDISKKWFIRENITLGEIEDVFFEKRENGKTYVRKFDKNFPEKNKYIICDSANIAKQNFSDILGWGSYKDGNGLRVFEKVNELLLNAIAFKSSEIKKFNDFTGEYLLPDFYIDTKTFIESSESSKKLLEEMNLSSEKIRLLNEIKVLAEDYNKKINDLEALKIVNFIDKKNSTQSVIKELEKQIQENENKISLLNSQIEKIETEIDEKENRKNDITINGGLEVTNKRINFLNSEINRLNKETSVFSSVLEKFKKIISAIKENSSFPDMDTSISSEEIYSEFFNIVKDAEEIIEEYNEKILNYKRKINEINTEISLKENELRELEKNKFTLDKNTDILLSELNKALKANNRPQAKLLYQMIDIKDKAWQSAVEALMRGTRTDIFVEPEDYPLALSVYKKIENIYNASIIDTRKLAVKKTEDNPDSLASIVTSNNHIVSEYIRHRFNHIYLVENIQNINESKGNTFLSKDLFYYSNFSVKRLQKVTNMVGAEAIKVQISETKDCLAVLKSERRSINDELSNLENIIKNWKNKDLNIVKDPTHLKNNILNFYDLEKYNDEYSKLISDSKNKELMMSIDKLQKEIRSLKDESKKHLINKGQLENIIKSNLKRISENEGVLDEIFKKIEEAKNFDMNLFQAAEEKYQRILMDGRHKDISFYISNTINLLNDQIKENNRDLIDKERYYNDFSQSDYPTLGIESINEYLQILDSISGEIFEQAKMEFERTTNNMKEIVNRLIIDNLRKHIIDANKYIKSLNNCLKNVNFMGNEFEISNAKPRSDKRDIFAAIMTPEKISKEEYNEIIDTFINQIIDAKDNEYKLRELTDYKEYCEFEAKIKNVNTGVVTSLDNFCKAGSGSENQFPYYIILSAALSQAFGESSKSKDISNSNSLRIMFVDECFDKMDKENTKNLIDFMKETFGIQLITSAPSLKFDTVGYCMDNILYVDIKEDGSRRIIPFVSPEEFRKAIEDEEVL